MALHPSLQIFTTADGSPTLSLLRQDGYAEKMHHSGGALTESLYIYHYGLTTALDREIPARVISVGLGLAYNELICLAEFRRRGLTGKIWSFEAMPYLREQFTSWLDNPAGAYGEIVNDVASRIEKHFGIEDLRGLARAAVRNQELELRAEFPADTAQVTQAGVVFYDAFSNKMSPELWQEEQLQNDLGPLLAPHALVCTYAKTGAMKRVLKNLNFEMRERPGFQGKRDSTLAVR